MRMTTLLKKLLGIQHLLVTGFTIEDGALVIEVRPSWRTPRCSGCTKPRGRDDTLPPRRWRHLDFGGVRVYLRYGLRRPTRSGPRAGQSPSSHTRGPDGDRHR